MKFGILTFHNIPNIGALLQAYSLCLTIRNRGVDCDIIDYISPNIVERELRSPKTGNLIKDIAIRILFWPKMKKKIVACQDFMNTMHVYSENHYDRSNIKKSNIIYDAFISGSDMIWNLSITNNDLTYFLDFVDEEKPKFSYGSSIGEEWSVEEANKVLPYLKKFKLMAVREEDTRQCINSMGLNCELVSDPTLLLTSDEWREMTIPPREKNYVIVYFPTEENLSAASTYAKRNNKQVLVMNWSRKLKHFTNISPNNPAKWMSYIRFSDAVFTNSYHGLLFALYFNRPVWTSNKGNRIMSLLQKLHIENRLINNDQSLKTTINYNSVNIALETFRNQSLAFIDRIISVSK